MITVTEILGTDNIGASRITINNNFNTVKTAINSITSFVDAAQIGVPTQTVFVGNSATIGGVTIASSTIQINNKVLNETCIDTLNGIVNNGTLWLNSPLASLNIGNVPTATGLNEPFIQVGDQTLTANEIERLKLLISGS